MKRAILMALTVAVLVTTSTLQAGITKFAAKSTYKAAKFTVKAAAKTAKVAFKVAYD